VLKRVLALSLFALLGTGVAHAEVCAIDFVPGSTLLLPYFEVDIDNPQGVDTIFTINNASASATLTHVTVWTDLSVEALDFNVYLTGYDMQTVSMGLMVRDGIIPVTASAGQDPTDQISPHGPISQDINFASCNGTLPYDVPIDPTYIDHLQSILTGGPSDIYDGNCGGLDHGDRIARGYVTVDVTNACTILNPCDPGYFIPGGGGIGGNRNIIWGNFYMIDRSRSLASSGDLVSVEAVPGIGSGPFNTYQGVDPGQLNGSFWNRCNDYTALPYADQRESLPTTFGVNYFLSESFAGQADLIVWRDSLEAMGRGFDCGVGPDWYPLTNLQTVAFDEAEEPAVPPPCTVSPCPENNVPDQFPAEAQRVSVASLEFPWESGWIYLDLDQVLGGIPTRSQAWVSVIENAEGHFSAGATAVALDSYCFPNLITLPTNF
jgi:hypothetical protein